MNFILFLFKISIPNKDFKKSKKVVLASFKYTICLVAWILSSSPAEKDINLWGNLPLFISEKIVWVFGIDNSIFVLLSSSS